MKNITLERKKWLNNFKKLTIWYRLNKQEPTDNLRIQLNNYSIFVSQQHPFFLTFSALFVSSILTPSHRVGFFYFFGSSVLDFRWLYISAIMRTVKVYSLSKKNNIQ